MKTIEVISGEQKAIFTTRSVTFDGREFLYINMSDVSNDTDSHVYTFRYDNEIKRLPYEAKDAAILNAIFSQVKGLPAKQAAAAESDAAQNAAAEQTAGTVDTGDKPEGASVNAEGTSGNAETAPADANAAADKADDAGASSEMSPEKNPEKGTLISKFSFKKSAGSDDSAASENDAEKKARFRKSIIVFAIIIAAMAVLALVYFFHFGTSDDPSSMNPASTNTQSYDDIDELIDDLQ